MNFKINIAGVKELQARLNNVSKEVHKEVLGEIKDAAQKWVEFSKRDAPVFKGENGGTLRQGITADISPSWGASVISNANYSPYIEWGTVTKVDVPGELAEYAIQFKGRGIRKNGGIIPRPFFFKQRAVIEKMLIKNINNVLDNTKL